MRYHVRVGLPSRRALVLCLALGVGGCDQAPTWTGPSRFPLGQVRTPTPAPGPADGPSTGPVDAAPTGPPISVLAIKGVTFDGTVDNAAISIRLAETDGRSDALVTSVTVDLADGAAWSRPLQCGYCSGTRVAAGGEVTIAPLLDPYGDYMWSFTVPRNYAGRLAVTVGYQDEAGRKGGVSELVPVPWSK